MGDSDMERRMYKRVEMTVNFRYLLPLDTFDLIYTASTFDLGKGGIGLVSDVPVSDGTTMIVEMDPAGCGIDQKPFRIQSQCIWCEPKEGKFHIGIMFYYFNEELRDRVSNFVAALDQQTAVQS